MPLEPIAASNFFLKFLSAIDRLSSWLLACIAIFLVVFLWVPEFRTLAPTEWLPWIKCAAVLFGILAAGKIISLLLGFIPKRKAQFDVRRFHVMPTHQCHWAITPQPNGSIVTQISGNFMVKNRTNASLQLLHAHVVKPKIRGELLQDLVLIKSEHSNMYGTSAVSGQAIPPGASLPIAITILYRGVPRQKHSELSAVIAFVDEEGNEQRVKTHFKAMHPPSTDKKELRP